ncbi:enoyl-CoA hydratase/isomerase family protein [Mesorhizobium sp. 1B3]|uniref:enoyl-CoA hydratase/isomerase family protein n=1 Tax=Mesorhizobium sp. 1B3 TaxID=3243599 RepID=UPI003D98203A
MSEQEPAVRFRVADGVAEIRFNRPARLNALDVETACGFEAAADRALDDPSVRVIVVSAEGRGFVAGGDLQHFHRSQDRAAAAAELIGPMHRALARLAKAPVITLGSLKGAVAGAGMSIALNLDLAIAAEDTVFNLAYSRIGAPPDCGASFALPRLVGLRRALEIALLSDDIDALQALALGIVNRVVPVADLESETTRLAARLAAGAPAAQGRIKALMRESLARDLPWQLDAEAAAFAECASTEDFSGAVAAFLEKRKPQFNGR